MESLSVLKEHACFFAKANINAYEAICDQATLAAMIDTGLRRSEVARLSWAMINSSLALRAGLGGQARLGALGGDFALGEGGAG